MDMRQIIHRVLWAFLYTYSIFASQAAEYKDYASYVNPFIGTNEGGNCFPGATRPLGMVQPSPESTSDYYKGYEGKHISGYLYDDPYIWGFTQTHLSGVGCPTLSDILLQPFCGDLPLNTDRTGFRSAYDKASEKASPGYYAVELTVHQVKVELTATHHVAYHRYTYHKEENKNLLIDLQYGVSWHLDNVKYNIIEANQCFKNRYTLCGYRKAREWTQRKLYYVIQWNIPVSRVDTLAFPNGQPEKAPRLVLHFDGTHDTVLELCVGLSTVSEEQALKNLQSEFGGWGRFDLIREDAHREWNELLGKIAIQGDENRKINFYTACYHLYIQPNNLADVDGTYRAENDSVYKSPSGKFFSTISAWDIYRAACPMYSLLTPNLSEEIVTSLMLAYMYKERNGNEGASSYSYLPRWGLWGREVHTMIANHSVPVVADAWLKGIKSPFFTDEQVFKALWCSVTKPHHGNHVDLIDYYGYIPYDDAFSNLDNHRETVSRLLEGIYDDYCVAQVAKALDKSRPYAFLMNRASYYKNVYDAKSGFMRGRNSHGEFKTNADNSEIVGEWINESDYTEANAYHYRFHVQHDIRGLIDLIGGEKVLSARLDSMFFAPKIPHIRGKNWRLTGCLGQYWHGNEPCHHLPYLYKYTPEGYKTDLLMRYITTRLYSNSSCGLPGSDDCGQMSAWYMFACMGFYPVNPCGGDFVLGAPQFEEMVLNLPNSKHFFIEAKNLTDDNYEVGEIALNGKRLHRNYITYDEIIGGGTLTFHMKKGKLIIGESLFKTE